jgi:hypothetical protein
MKHNAIQFILKFKCLELLINIIYLINFETPTLLHQTQLGHNIIQLVSKYVETSNLGNNACPITMIV